MIEPEEIAAYAYGKAVNSAPNRKPFLLIFSVDDAPALSTTVTASHIKNRSKVTQGQIVSWGEHGRVAILEGRDGNQAAFHYYELNS
mgnify:CR=1 FL=1